MIEVQYPQGLHQGKNWHAQKKLPNENQDHPERRKHRWKRKIKPWRRDPSPGRNPGARGSLEDPW
jgi:hypothetical protein